MENIMQLGQSIIQLLLLQMKMVQTERLRLVIKLGSINQSLR